MCDSLLFLLQQSLQMWFCDLGTESVSHVIQANGNLSLDAFCCCCAENFFFRHTHPNHARYLTNERVCCRCSWQIRPGAGGATGSFSEPSAEKRARVVHCWDAPRKRLKRMGPPLSVRHTRAELQHLHRSSQVGLEISERLPVPKCPLVHHFHAVMSHAIVTSRTRKREMKNVH